MTLVTGAWLDKRMTTRLSRLPRQQLRRHFLAAVWAAASHMRMRLA